MQVQLNTTKPNYNPYFKGYTKILLNKKNICNPINTSPKADKEIYNFITGLVQRYETFDNLYKFWYDMEKDEISNFCEGFTNILKKYNLVPEDFELPTYIKECIKHIKARIEYRPEPFSNFDKTFPSYTITIGKKFKIVHEFDWKAINKIQ